MAQRKEEWWWIEHEVIRSVWIRSSGVEWGKDVEKEQATELRERERKTKNKTDQEEDIQRSMNTHVFTLCRIESMLLLLS